MFTTRPETNCRFKSNCTKRTCPFAHCSPCASGEAGSNIQVCKFGSACNRSDCDFAHASPAFYAADENVLAIRLGRISLAGGSPGNENLLRNFQRMFDVKRTWINELQESLADSSSRIVLIFVDLDNVPRFFDQISRSMVDSLPFEVFIVCSARSTRHVSWKSNGKLHFSLANPTKDAADAVCTVAAAKLDSILVSFGRQRDVPLVIVSDDRIFQQVRDLLDRGGSRAYTLGQRGVAHGVRMLSDLVRPALARGSESSSSGAEEEWACADCDRVFASEHSLGQHCRATGHDPAGSDSGSGSWCDSDESDSDASDSDSGSDDWAFRCRTCQQGFRTRGSLLQHSRAKRH